MIKLASSKIQFKTTINHTGVSSGGFYPITHNLGTKEIDVSIYDPVEGVQMGPYCEFGASNFGYAMSSLTDTSCTIVIFLWGPFASPANNNRTVNVTITAL